jgi:hypothetical protein
MLGEPSQYEMAMRSELLGLQFALSGLPEARPAEPLDPAQAGEALAPQSIDTALKVVNLMHEYSLGRDAFLSYIWRAYELAPSGEGETVLRFIDPPDWPGYRDRAERTISQEIKGEFARSFTPKSSDPIEVTLEKAVSLPGDLPMGGISARQFIAGWNVLLTTFGKAWLEAKTPILEREALLDLITQGTGLAAPQAGRFLDLLIYSGADSALTLFHCPVVPLTNSSVAVIPSALLLGNPSAIAPRLSIRRGPGIDSFSQDVEAHLLACLQHQFEAPNVFVRTRTQYQHAGDEGDIDLVAYEQSTNRLVVGELKGFIPPDSVEEVHRANESLEHALDQLERVRRWLASILQTRWLQELRIDTEAVPREVDFVVIGNGFVGSDYLAIPGDVTIVDAQWLLLPRFRHTFPGAAIRLFRERFEKIMVTPRPEASRVRLALGDVQIEVPDNS